MTKNIKIYKKLNIIKKKNIKYVLKKIILKSIFHSNDVYNQQRVLSIFLLKKYKIKIQNKNTKNVCFETSKIKTTNRKIGLSRYCLKKNALLNQLQNINVYSK